MTTDMIDLGLTRIAALVPAHFPWRAVHIAGTNGKGSICAYLSSILTPRLRTGRFTTPHHLHPSDSIHLNNTPCPPPLFAAAHARVRARARELNIAPTPFELLTATAFDIFTAAHIDLAIIEVGVGGRLDATNIIPPPVCAAVASIALDHAPLLGGTLQAIAREKAGIVKAGCAVVVDAGNARGVREVVAERAREVGARVREVAPVGVRPTRVQSVWGVLEIPRHLPGEFQARNVAVAVAVAEEVAKCFPGVTAEDVVRGIADTRWPGRLERVELRALGLAGSVLVDGAHNRAAAEALRGYVDADGDGEVTWVLAFSHGKDVREMVDVLVREGDAVVLTGFGAVEGMPWVRCVDPAEAARVVREAGRRVETAPDVVAAVRAAVGRARPVVVAGSLYLGSELARAIAAAQGEA